MKNGILNILLSLSLVVGFVPSQAFAAPVEGGENQTAIEEQTTVKTDEEQTALEKEQIIPVETQVTSAAPVETQVASATPVANNVIAGGDRNPVLTAGTWYTAQSPELLESDGYYHTYVDTRLEIAPGAHVTIHMNESCALHVTMGIHVPEGSSLTIEADGSGSTLGKLIGKGNTGKQPLIGANVLLNVDEWGSPLPSGQQSTNYKSENSGDVTINSGVIELASSDNSACIGAGANNLPQSDYVPSFGTITINGGIITASQSEYFAAIGCGYGDFGSGNIIINGGTLNLGASGIGAHGRLDDASRPSGTVNISITGGTINAGFIGAPEDGEISSVSITGGNLNLNTAQSFGTFPHIGTLTIDGSPYIKAQVSKDSRAAVIDTVEKTVINGGHLDFSSVGGSTRPIEISKDCSLEMNGGYLKASTDMEGYSAISIHTKGTFSMNGTGVIDASDFSYKNLEAFAADSLQWRGVLKDDTNKRVLWNVDSGKTVVIPADFEVPAEVTAAIPSNTTVQMTNGSTFTNNGDLYVCGKIVGNFTNNGNLFVATSDAVSDSTGATFVFPIKPSSQDVDVTWLTHVQPVFGGEIFALGNADLKFTVQPHPGFNLDSISYDGSVLAPVDGVYTIKKSDLGKSSDLVVTLSKQTTVEAANTEWVAGSLSAVGEVTLDNRVAVKGEVHLYLQEGAVLNAPKGIHVGPGNKLVIDGPGTLNAGTDWDRNAAIGGNDTEAGGTIIINSGTIETTNTIGSGGLVTKGSSETVIEINGGTVNAQASGGGCAIGSGVPNLVTEDSVNNVTITITGGNVTATTSGRSNEAIGVRSVDKGTCTLNVLGGTVIAGDVGANLSLGTNPDTFISVGKVNNYDPRTPTAEQLKNWRGVVGATFYDTTQFYTWIKVYRVFGNANLNQDLVMPDRSTLIVPEDTTLTLGDGVTITNNPADNSKDNPTIKVEKGGILDASAGSVEGNPPVVAPGGEYRPGVFTVDFDLNGKGSEPVDTQQVQPGEKASEPKAPKAAGYTFGGWYTEPECKNAWKFTNAVNQDITLYAKWTANTDTKYVVKHFQQNIDNDEYTEVVKDAQQMQGTTDALTAAEPKVYEGFTAQAVSQQTIASDGSTEVQIYYDRNVYTVKWLNDEGTLVDTTQVKYGAVPSHEAITKTETTQYTYTFKEWSPAITEATANAQYTAVFDAKVRSYNVTFVDYDNTQIGEVQSVEYGKDAKAPADPQREGYTFTGWNVDFSNIQKDITVKATYAINQYTVSFDAQGGSEAKAVTQDFGSKVTLPETTLEGYTFLGWFDNAEGTGEAITAYTVPANNATLYAKWAPNTDTPYVVKHFQQNIDNDEYTEVTADAVNMTGTTGAQTAAEALTYEGFTAKGIEQQTIAADGTTVVEIYYDRNTYTVSWKNGKAELETDTVRHGAMPSYDGKTPVKAEDAQFTYEFSGWTPEVAQATADVTYEATFASTVRSYEVKFVDYDGTQIGKTQTVTYGEGATAPDDPARTGYTFKGWNVAFDSVTGPLTVTATYAINQYTVSFDAQGGSEAKAVTQDFGSKVTLPETTLEGYTFLGWFDNAEGTGEAITAYTVPANNATLYAKWALDAPAVPVIEVTPKDGSSTYPDAVTLSIDYTEINGLTYTYQWFKDNEAIKGAQAKTFSVKTVAESGEYQVIVTVTDGTQTQSSKSLAQKVDIRKAVITGGITDVEALTYNGNDQTAKVANDFVTAGKQEFTVEYSTAVDGVYAANVPAFKDAGTHTVYYRVSAPNHNDKVGMFDVVIADAAITGGITDVEALTYNGNNQAANVANNFATLGNQEFTVEYSTAADGEYTANVPAFTEAGDYTVYYRATAPNHDAAEGSFVVTIAAKDIAGAQVTLGDALTYNGKEQTQTVSSVTIDGLDVTYNVSGNAVTNAGNYELTVTGTGNFTGTVTQKFAVANAQASIIENVAQIGKLTYNGEAQTAEVTYASATVGDQKPQVTYSAKYDGEYTANVPAFTEAGDYTVYYRATAPNHDAAEGSFVVTIAAKDVADAETVQVVLGSSLTYNGKEQTQAVSSVTADGLPVTFEVAQNTATNAGTYNLTITGTGNFTGTYTQQFVIAQAPAKKLAAEVNLVRQTPGYTQTLTLSEVAGFPQDAGSVPELALSSTNVEDKTTVGLQGDVLTIVADDTEATESGSAVIALTGMKNYQDSQIVVTINYTDKTPVAISGVEIADKVYDGKPIAYTGKPIVKLVDEDSQVQVEDLVFTWQSVAGEILNTAPENAGSYNLVISVPRENSLYAGSMTIPCTIEQAPLTLTVDNVTAHVNDEKPIFTYQVKGLFGEDEIAGDVTFIEKVDMAVAGEYVIEAEGAKAPNANYQETITYVPGTLTVTDHVFGEWEETKKPTETAEGEKQRVCEICGEVEKTSIEKLPATSEGEAGTNGQPGDSVGVIPATNDGTAHLFMSMMGLAIMAAVGVVTALRRRCGLHE